MFSGLIALKELNMQDNSLMSISDQSFVSLKKSLKIVRLSRNNLTLNPDRDMFQYRDEYGAKSPFHDCEELERDRSRYSHVFLHQFQSVDLQFLSNNIKVDLTHNKIRHIFLRDAEDIASPQKFPRDVIVLVDNNPLNCDCNLYDFLRYIEGRMHPKVQEYFHIIPQNLTCQSPKSLRNIRVTDLRSKSLTCTMNQGPNITCPQECDCSYKPEDQTCIFDCSHRKLTQVPNDIKQPSHSCNLKLNFSDNRLTRMPDLRKLGLRYVKELILSHNNISEIFLDELSSTLTVRVIYLTRYLRYRR